MRTKVSEQKIKEGKRWRGTSVRYTWHKHIHIVDRLEYALYVSIDGDNNNKKNLNPNNNESSRIITEQYGFKRDIREWSSDGCFFFGWLNYSHYIPIVDPNNFSMYIPFSISIFCSLRFSLSLFFPLFLFLFWLKSFDCCARLLWTAASISFPYVFNI